MDSIDIEPNLLAAENVEKWAPHLIDRWSLKYGRDVSAYLEDIGGNIDFCVLDIVHCVPGEVLNFLCILPYLKNGATVVIDDLLIPFQLINDFPLETAGRTRIKKSGAASTIACSVLFDCVVADKRLPNFCARNNPEIPNISSFEVSEET